MQICMDVLDVAKLAKVGLLSVQLKSVFFQNHRLDIAIVSRGDWLGNAANFKRLAYCFDFDVERGSHVTM